MDTSGPSPTIQIDATTVMFLHQRLVDVPLESSPTTAKPTTISTLENRASKEEEAISVEVKERAWLIFQLIAGLIMERYKKARKDIATVIGVSQILVAFGSAVGNAVAGGIWTQHLPLRLRERVTGPYDRDRTMNDSLNYVKNLDPVTKQQVMAPTATRKSLRASLVCPWLP
ncbi:hypothetical protein BGZ59_009176 [Podila verticillata]|nr:hypothetical protein BGZ59_009176 [Podila verticillata]